MNTFARLGHWLPWRWATPGWFALALILIYGVPLFIRMPLWCDATLYDMAARNVLSGGTHYRDLFDTNPPGFVWLVCGIRAVADWSSESLRIADLLVVAGIVFMLLRWAKAAGADRAGCAWTAAAIASFYLFSSEFNHTQRDVWMMFPAALAVLIRIRRIDVICTHQVTAYGVFCGAVLEAAVWGLGFWVKPHLGLVAGVVWLVSAPRLAFAGPHPFKRMACDIGGQLSGLGVVAALGVGWLMLTGAWPYYLDVNQNWNTGYWDLIRAEQSTRDEVRFAYFPPWSAALRLALPLAIVNLLLGMRPHANPRQFARALLAATLLVWFAIGLYLQRPFMYVHIPEVFLLLALFAANGWAVSFWLLLLRIAAGTFLLLAPHNACIWDWHSRTHHDCIVYRELMNPTAAFDPDRARWWRHCFHADVPRELRLGVSLDAVQLGGQDPVQLGEVENFLRSHRVADGELLCWHEATHSLYLTLNVRPPIRFMHVGTAMSMGPWQRDRVAAETLEAMPGVKFAVSDLHRVTWHRDSLLELDADGLPHCIPMWQRAQFPFDQPVVFRSATGRYLVHRIVNPVRECVVPDAIDQVDPPAWWQSPPGWKAPQQWQRGWREPG